MKHNQQGFTLFEVLISMFIAGVAVLGLVMLELNILRSSQSSFNYTLATIEANTLVDKTWQNLCAIKEDPARYTSIYNDWKDDLTLATRNYSSFRGKSSKALATAFTVEDIVVVRWAGNNFADTNDDAQVILNVSYPDFSGLCN